MPMPWKNNRVLLEWLMLIIHTWKLVNWHKDNNPWKPQVWKLVSSLLLLFFYSIFWRLVKYVIFYDNNGNQFSKVWKRRKKEMFKNNFVIWTALSLEFLTMHLQCLRDFQSPQSYVLNKVPSPIVQCVVFHIWNIQSSLYWYTFEN